MPEMRSIWGEPPPEHRSALSNWPTVLFSWWCTSFAAVMIITRVLGRKVRSDRLFREDWIMLLSAIPLFIRMILIHFVLIYGTNNINTTNRTFTEIELYHHSIGARLVLPARIFYAMFIWFNKLSVSEFLKRITLQAWRRSWELTLQGIRIFLFVTFGAVVIATLAECQPFNHYWQVIPDPGAHCRQGFAQLLTMGTCDIVTDVLLIAFPIPVVLKSGQSWQRKLQMGALFSLSIVMIAVTASRMPQVIMHQGRQQYRTVWASCEILASAAVSNGVILGSFLRDKGTKRNKYRTNSYNDSIDRTSTRRPTVVAIGPTGSDEDLFRSLGCRMPSHLQNQTVIPPRPAPPAMPAAPSHRSSSHNSDLPPINTMVLERASNDSIVQTVLHQVLPSPAPSTDRSASFFDVGNLLEDEVSESPTYSPHWVDSGNPAIEAHDFAGSSSSPGSSLPGSSAFLRDIGGMLSDVRSSRFPRRDGRDNGLPRSAGERHRNSRLPQTAPVGVLGPTLERQESEMPLQDAGGLLGSMSYSAQAGSSSHSISEWTSVVSRSGASVPQASTQQYHEDIELEDIGGLLSGNETQTDRAAVALQQTPQRHGARSGGPQLQRQEREQPSALDDIVLSDPGGLMKG